MPLSCLKEDGKAVQSGEGVRRPAWVMVMFFVDGRSDNWI